MLTRHFKPKWLRLFIVLICFFLVLKMITWQWLLSTETKQRNDYQNEGAVFMHKNNDIDIKHEKTGLTANEKQFKIDGSPITILSGAVHYFRFPPEYWEDRLLKMKACGLNTIETYVPWNLHEPVPGKFDFGGNLNLSNFLELAQKLGFYVLLRPGPYICSEWEFGGLPSWLLRDPSMKVRTMHLTYINAVVKYFAVLLPIVKPFQYKLGGPIIAFQLDNEYGAYFNDDQYIPFLKDLMEKKGINELFFVSDNIEDLKKQTVPDVLKTVNFKHVGENLINLQALQPNAPLMVMEFWTGWFDWWGDIHHKLTVQEFGEILNEILSANSSVNFYMFFGGTNFGFMNGGFKDEIYKSDVTSYDYDALIAENGDLTPKYYKAKKLIAQYYPKYVPDKIEIPAVLQRKAYTQIPTTEFVTLWDILHLLPNEKSELPISMEMLSINNGAGQSYGYILYSAEYPTSGFRKLNDLQHLNDRGIVFIDKEAVLRVDEENKYKEFVIPPDTTKTLSSIELLIENGGRINWRELDNQRKGLLGPVAINGNVIKNWTIYPLEMKQDFITNLQSVGKWTKLSLSVDLNSKPPSFFKTTLTISDTPVDTYLDMSEWGKGVVFVNGKNLGRYWSVGPQKTLYLPAPWLKSGRNDIIVFEENQYASEINFSADPKFD